MKILVITPWAPVPVTGACQQDRFYGLQQMFSLDWDVHLIARYHSWQDKTAIEQQITDLGVQIEKLYPHSGSRRSLLQNHWLDILKNPVLLDGAALEYMDSGFQQTVMDTVRTLQPDVIWLEYTVLWPLIRVLKPTGIPIIMKSSINEPLNCIDEHDGSLLSRLKAIPKFGSEKIAARESDFLLAISPREEDWYQHHGATRTGVLPLRGLSRCLHQKTHDPKDVLDMIFMGSNYNIGHNRRAALFLLNDVMPKLRQAAPGRFRLHITGKKIPDSIQQLAADDVTFTGFLDDLGAYCSNMDLAMTPSLAGQGMQQKIFEPFCRSIPQITHHTCGYDFVPDTEVLIGSTADDFVAHALSLQNADKRNRLSEAAFRKAQQMFNEAALQQIVQDTVAVVIQS